MRDQEDASTKSQRRPFRIERWRVNGGLGELTRTSQQPINRNAEPAANDGQVRNRGSNESLNPRTTELCRAPSKALLPPEPAAVHDPGTFLPAAHPLPDLIIHNVFRGLMYNKSVLRVVADYMGIPHNPSRSADRTTECGPTVVLRPSHRTMPIDLLPTQLQMNNPHPSWIDTLPFPRIRDNLIRRQQNFNHTELLEDLVSDLVYLHPLSRQGQRRQGSTTGLQNQSRRHEDQSTQYGKGIILWGEPHLKENWEVTVQFLTKWSWAVEGCAELVDISNKWRTRRGEHAIQAPKMSNNK